MYHLDPKLVIQVFQFLLSLYSARRSGAKPPRREEEPHDETLAVGEVPNPDKIKELIEEVKEEPKQSAEGISAAIDRKFAPAEAQQVKDDFATFALLASPPDFADYNFIGIIQNYAKGIQAIALKMDLFRLRGSKYRNAIRVLDMAETAASLAPLAEANAAVYTPGDIVFASVKKRMAILTNLQEEFPLALLLEAEFRYASYGLSSGQRTETGVQAYKLRAGQESNWLGFYFAYQNFAAVHPAFAEFEYRLTASGVKTILAALKKDIVAYLADVESERPVIQELRRELDGLSRIASQT